MFNCDQGRPTTFIGSWYTSVFVHFYPKEGWLTETRDYESHFAIPPNWRDTRPSILPSLQWIGTSAREPECPDSWCHLINAVHWEGPGEFGQVMTGGGQKYPLKKLGDGEDDDEEL